MLYNTTDTKQLTGKSTTRPLRANSGLDLSWLDLALLLTAAFGQANLGQEARLNWHVLMWSKRI